MGNKSDQFQDLQRQYGCQTVYSVRSCGENKEGGG